MKQRHAKRDLMGEVIARADALLVEVKSRLDRLADQQKQMQASSLRVEHELKTVSKKLARF